MTTERSSEGGALSLPGACGGTLEYHAEGKTLKVKKLRPDSFFALIDGEKQGRFGDSRQITEDIEHFLLSGALPRAKRSLV